MILILHGTNIVASRKVLVEQKEQASEKGIEIIDLTGKALDLTELKQALESASLFSSDRLVVIENLFSLPKSKTKEEILNYLKSSKLETGLVIWEGKQIDGRVLKSFANRAKIQIFKLPAVIFKFLDSFNPKDPKTPLTYLHQTLKTEPIELVFYMLARRTKDLLIAKDLGGKGLVQFAPWQKSKLLYQAEKFSLRQLLDLHRSLLKIDWKQKTGQSILSLSLTLDLLILTL